MPDLRLTRNFTIDHQLVDQVFQTVAIFRSSEIAIRIKDQFVEFFNKDGQREVIQVCA